MSRLSIPAGARAVSTFGPWTLFELPPSKREDASFLWLHFRLMLPLTTPKRNGQQRAYRLYWNPAEARLARGGQAYALLQRNPELHAQVVLDLGMSYPRSWLTSTGGVTEAEIDVEAARLAARRQRLEAERATRRPARRGAMSPSSTPIAQAEGGGVDNAARLR